jgi:hypothetical protein
MPVETAFCTNCGAVVDETWELCEACGAEQPVEVTAIGKATALAGEAPSSAPAPDWSAPLTRLGLHTTAATYFFAIGAVCIVAGIIYLLATTGFPPGITTTYEYHPDGSTSTSTSPDTVEGLINIGLFVIGAVLLRASREANSSSKK